jgi:hypothetical protein
MQVALQIFSRRAGRAAGVACAVLGIVLSCRICPADNDAKTSSKSNASAQPLDSPIRLAKSSRDSLKNVTDYVARFQKKERVGNRFVSHTMIIKHRLVPFSVYLRFIGEHDGREVIYVDGMNGGHLLAHETGLASIVGTVALKPTSAEAMSESIHPITDIGMWNLVDKIIAQWEAENKHGEVKVQYFPNARLGDKTECKVIEATHPNRRPHFKYHRTRLYIDKQTNFPVRVEQFGFPAEEGAEPPIMGEYQYSDIRPNQSLTDLDFSTKNPKYGY